MYSSKRYSILLYHSGDGYLTISELSKALPVIGVQLDESSIEALFK